MNRNALRHGWSLTETLVVVAIILLLLAMLAPSLYMAKEHARRAMCANNLKQWGMAVQEYRDENSDFLPTEGTFLPDPITGQSGVLKPHAWYNALPPYLGLPAYKDLEGANVSIRELPELHVWICPSKNLSRLYKSESGMNQFHYGMNAVLDGFGAPPQGSADAPGFPDWGDEPIRAGALKRVASAVLLFDVAPNSMFGSPRDVATKFYRDFRGVRPAKFHGDYAGMLYVDGGVTSCGIDDLVTGRDNRRGAIVWNHAQLYWGYSPRKD